MIPEYLLAKIEKSDVIYRCIGNEMKNGILACGFMRKETADRSQYHFSNELPCAPGKSAAGSDRGRLRYALAES